MDVVTGKIGPLNIKIKGEGYIFKVLCHELIADNTSKEERDNKFDLIVNISNLKEVKKNYSPQFSSAKTHMSFNEQAFFHDDPKPYYCQNLFSEKTCILHLKPVQLNWKRKIVKRVFPKNEKTGEISYSLFWYVINLLLLRKKASFLHAGIFSSNGAATAFVGTGGSGKTSLLFKMLEGDKKKYIAEDFGIINNDGNVFLNSKTVSIYDSDIQSNMSILQDYFNKMDFAVRMKWKFDTKIRSKNPIVKARVTDIFHDDKLCQKTKLEKVFFIVRSNVSTPKIEEVSTEEISERSLAVNLREMKKLNEILNLINANAPQGYPYISLLKYINMTKSIYTEAFSDSQNYLLYVPFKTKAEELKRFLEEKA